MTASRSTARLMRRPAAGSLGGPRRALQGAPDLLRRQRHVAVAHAPLAPGGDDRTDDPAGPQARGLPPGDTPLAAQPAPSSGWPPPALPATVTVPSANSMSAGAVSR